MIKEGLFSSHGMPYHLWNFINRLVIKKNLLWKIRIELLFAFNPWGPIWFNFSIRMLSWSASVSLLDQVFQMAIQFIDGHGATPTSQIWTKLIKFSIVDLIGITITFSFRMFKSFFSYFYSMLLSLRQSLLIKLGVFLVMDS